MSNSDNQYFLMLGAYRNNEVSSTHPLVNTLNKIKQGKVIVNEISLSPLKFTHINQLIADTLSCSSEISKPLAKLIRNKTNGNPFFLTQLLYYLYQESLLVFQEPQSLINTKKHQKCYWQWDIEKIKRVSITDNVVELMVSKIEKLELKISAKSENDKLFGSVTNSEISKELSSEGFEIEKKCIQLSSSIKKIGSYTAKIRLHREVYYDLNFDVVSSQS